jgi:hypothetical protein
VKARRRKLVRVNGAQVGDCATKLGKTYANQQSKRDMCVYINSLPRRSLMKIDIYGTDVIMTLTEAEEASIRAAAHKLGLSFEVMLNADRRACQK